MSDKFYQPHTDTAGLLDIAKNLYKGFGNNPRNIETANAVKAYLGAFPIIGAPIAASDIYQGVQNKNPMQVGLGTLGVVGSVPSSLAARGGLLNVSREISPWTVTQEFIPGTENQIRNIAGKGFDVALSDPQKLAYTQEILSGINKLPGEIGGSRWTGAGWWDNISNPVIGMNVSQPKSNVEAIMAGLGRGSSQAAEAASQKVFGGGILGGTKNAVEINLGKPATKAQIAKLQDTYGSDFAVTASAKGVRLFSYTDDFGNPVSIPADVIAAGKKAAKDIGGKAKPYVGQSMYYPSSEYERLASQNPVLAEQIRRQTAEAAQAANANIIKQNPLQRFSYSPAEEILRKKQY